MSAAKVLTISIVVAMGFALWFLNAQTANEGPAPGGAMERATRAARAPDDHPPIAKPEAVLPPAPTHHVRESVVAHVVEVPSKEPEPVALSDADFRQLRRAIGAPHQFDWEGIASIDALNPRHVGFDEKTNATIAAVAMARAPLLEQLGKESARTTTEELAALKEAGQAVVIRAGESPYKKVGVDAVYSMALGSGEGIAASKSRMPRLLEVESRLQAIGKDMFVEMARILREQGVLRSDEEAAFSLVIKNWPR